LLGGIVLLLEPSLVERVPEAPASAGRVLGLVLLAPPWLYAIGSLLHFRPMTIWGFEIIYPRPPIALRQFLAGPVEVIGAAGIIYFALPAADNPGFLIVLGAFIAAFSLALISHAPGGLGVLELTFLNVVPDAPRADVIAALLVFRLFYLVIPLVFSLSMVLLFERQRFGSLLSSSRKP